MGGGEPSCQVEHAGSALPGGIAASDRSRDMAGQTRRGMRKTGIFGADGGFG